MALDTTVLASARENALASEKDREMAACSRSARKLEFYKMHDDTDEECGRWLVEYERVVKGRQMFGPNEMQGWLNVRRVGDLTGQPILSCATAKVSPFIISCCSGNTNSARHCD